MKLLDTCYEKCLSGVPKVSPSVESMANDYLIKHLREVMQIQKKGNSKEK